MNYTLKPGMLEIEIPAEYNHLGITEFMKNYHISGKKRNDLFLSHGILLNRKHFYFVPFRQDDPEKKPRSAQADFSLLLPAAEAALRGEQLQPIL